MNSIPHKRIGKWIVAQNTAQRQTLENLHAMCRDILDVPANWISEVEARVQEHSRVRSPASLTLIA